MPTRSQIIARGVAAELSEQRKAEREERKRRAQVIDELDRRGWLKLSVPAIVGALDPLQEGLSKPTVVAGWDKTGKAVLDREEALAARPKVALTLTFPDLSRGPEPDKMAPLRWFGPFKCYAGSMILEEAQALAKRLGGAVRLQIAADLPLAAE